MKIDSINFNLKPLQYSFNNIKVTKPIYSIENNTEIKGVPSSYITFKSNVEDDMNLKFTEDGQELISSAEAIAKEFNHSEITPYHIILASIIITEENIKANKKAIDSNLLESVSTLNTLADRTANKNLIDKKEDFNYFLEETAILKEEVLSSLYEIPKSETVPEELNLSEDLVNYIKEQGYKYGTALNAYNTLGASFNTLTTTGTEYTSDYLKNFSSLTLYENVSDIKKNYMNLYDKRALEVWNKLAIGSNMFILSKDQIERDRIVASLMKTFDEPKHGNINSENSYLYVISDKASPETLYEEIKTLKESIPDKKLLFLVDLDKIWPNIMNVNEDGSADYKTELLALSGLAKDNVKLIFLQGDELHYLFMQTPLVKKSFSNFLTYNIPPIRTFETKDLLTNNKKLLKNIKIPFTKDAKELSIQLAEKIDGSFPDKAIDLMERISEYYGGEKKRITSKDVNEFAYVASDLFNAEKESAIIYDTGKTLATFYGKETTKKDIEALVRQIQTGRIGTQGMLIYSKDDEAGSGRKYTAEVIAGEAKVPFMEINAGDFATAADDEKGGKIMPANLISKLFSELRMAAKQNPDKTAIMYINNFEEFAFASPYMVGCKQAMNQVLREMEKAERDNINILVMGSTYEDYVDIIPVFARGFSQTIAVDSPAFNKQSRKEIIEHRIAEKNLPLAYRNKAEREKLINKLVKITEYLSYVQIKTLINKAEQIMIERDKKRATIGDFIEAYLQLEVGRTSHPEMQMFNKEVTVSHECGHATNLEIMNNLYSSKGKPWFKSRDVNFITLDPRGGFLGAVFEGKSDNIDYPFEAMFSDIVCAYGGHSCEKRFFDIDGSVGITQDLAQATAAAKRGVEYCGLGHNTGKISNAVRLRSIKYDENVFKDIDVILTNAKLASDMITEQFKDFNKWFTDKYSKLIGSDDCMVDGDDFRKHLNTWIATQSKSFKEDLSLMEDIILDIINASKKGKIYPMARKIIK
ncbi:MAG: AAA family ATPase [Cyanobacteria bacterium SIG31]|nr:AAA family ATPase [Cyanobacteria bacterium SIG31]